MNRLAASLRAFCLLCFLGLQIVLPIKAYAFLPLPFLVGAGGTAALEGMGVGAAVTGLVIAGFTALGGSDSKRTGQVAMSPSGVVLPSGWNVASDGTVTPPSTAATGTIYTDIIGGVTYTGTSISSFPLSLYNSTCVNYFGSWYSQAAAQSNVTYSTTSLKFDLRCHDPTYNRDQTITAYGIPGSKSCPSGYTLSGSTCNLSSASSVVKPTTAADGTPLPCQIIRTGNTFSFDGKNGSCPTGSNAQIVSPDGTVMSVINGNLNVLPVQGIEAMEKELAKSRPAVGSTTNAAGNTVLTQTYTWKASDGQLYTTTVSTEIGTDGKVKGQSSVTNAGSGSLAQPGAVAAPQNLTVTCTDVGTCDVAKDATLKDIKASLTPTATAPNTTHDPLYTKGTKTLTSVWNSFKASLASTAIVTFATGFFNVSVGGSCPTWSDSLPMGLPDFTVDQLCSPMADNMFLVVHGVLLVVAAWAAFKIAIDN